MEITSKIETITNEDHKHIRDHKYTKDHKQTRDFEYTNGDYKHIKSDYNK